MYFAEETPDSCRKEGVRFAAGNLTVNAHQELERVGRVMTCLLHTGLRGYLSAPQGRKQAI